MADHTTAINQLLEEKNAILAEISGSNPGECTPSVKLMKNTNDLLCAFLGKTEATITQLQATVNDNTLVQNTLVDRIKALEFDQAVLRGRVVQLENAQEDQEDILNDIMSRQMRNNVIVRTTGAQYKELRNETNAQTTLLFRNFLRDEMGVANAHNITVTRAHRIGKPIRNSNRPMIALVPMQEDMNRIFSKVSALKGSDNSITIQTPAAYAERKSHSYKKFKDAKNQGHPATLKHNGQLFINGELVKAQEPIAIPATSSNDLVEVIDEQLVGKSDYVFKDTHNFISHSVQIHSLKELRDALDIFTMEFQEAKHIPFAFRIRNGDGTMSEDFKSKRCPGSGPQILKHIRSQAQENVVTFLAHGYNDKNIDGKSKYGLIEQCVNSSLQDLKNVIIADRGGISMTSEQSSY